VGLSATAKDALTKKTMMIGRQRLKQSLTGTLMPLNLKFLKKRGSMPKVATVRNQAVSRNIVNASRVEFLALASVLVRAARTVRRVSSAILLLTPTQT